MSLLWIDACETLNPRPEWNAAAQALVAAPTGNGWRLTGNNGTNGVRRSMPASATVILGFRHMTDAFGAGAGFVSLHGDGGTTLHLQLYYDTAGHLVLRRGTTILTTSTDSLVVDVWRYIEVKATIHDTTGSCIVRVDGVEWINFTGDTRNAGTSTLIDAVTLRTPSSTFGVHFDDLYCCDGVDGTATDGGPNNDFLGDHKVEARVVTGTGSTSEWVGTDGNSVDNWALVDDNPPNTTDYVIASTPGARDLYTVADLASSTGSVKAIQVVTYAQKSDAGGASLKTVVKGASGTVAVGAGAPLSITWATYAGPLHKLDPDGVGWTIPAVNGVEIGVEVG